MPVALDDNLSCLLDGIAAPSATWLPVARHAGWGAAWFAGVSVGVIFEQSLICVMDGLVVCDPFYGVFCWCWTDDQRTVLALARTH